MGDSSRLAIEPVPEHLTAEQLDALKESLPPFNGILYRLLLFFILLVILAGKNGDLPIEQTGSLSSSMDLLGKRISN